MLLLQWRSWLNHIIIIGRTCRIIHIGGLSYSRSSRRKYTYSQDLTQQLVTGSDRYFQTGRWSNAILRPVEIEIHNQLSDRTWGLSSAHGRKPGGIDFLPSQLSTWLRYKTFIFRNMKVASLELFTSNLTGLTVSLENVRFSLVSSSTLPDASLPQKERAEARWIIIHIRVPFYTMVLVYEHHCLSLH